MSRVSPDELIRLLKLAPHPKEGGHFRETYRSPTLSNGRSIATAIYYLLTPQTFSAIHRLPGDEIFHHYLGDAVDMLRLHPDGKGEIVRIGKNIAAGETPQMLVPGGVWQGSRLVAGGAFALLGCTMSPGFDYADYEHGSRPQLMEAFPIFTEMIAALTT